VAEVQEGAEGGDEPAADEEVADYEVVDEDK
jgi:hypothetical protein